LGRLRILSGREVCAILSRHGFVEVRRKGSHIVVQAQNKLGTTTVTVPDHKELRFGTLRSIIRQSGVPASEFEVG
jgi:predicted RNA binding protein YcfA (HicA-like mRNA interferase family)